MKKYIFLPLCFMLINSASAEEVNLICDMTYRDGNSGSQKIKTRFEVSSYKNGDIFIIPDSDLLGSVSTSKNSNTLKVDNFSNSSKWHVRKIAKNNANTGIADTTIIIDRNAGSISYNSSFTFEGMVRNSSGFGYCEKINPKVKKF